MLCCLIAAISGCHISGGNEFRVLYIKKGLEVYNWSASKIYVGFHADSGKVVAMPVKEGDFLYVAGKEAEAYFRYTKDFPDTIQFKAVDSLVYMNGKLVALTIDSMRNILPFFRQMKPSDLKELRSLVFTSNIPAYYKPYLLTIAELNPAIDLSLINDTISFHEDLEWLAGHFKPVSLNTFLGEADFPILRKFTSVRDLSLHIEDSVVAMPLPELKHVRQLEIAFNKRNGRFPQNFLALNKQVTALSLISSSDTSKLRLDTFKDLKRLSILGDSLVYPPDLGMSFPRLESLFYFDTINLSASKLAGLKHLRELAISADIPQLVFDSIISNHPDLEYLQILNADTAQDIDYGTLQKAKRLAYLVIAGDTMDFKNLDQLHQLKYLSLPKGNFKDTTNINKLKKDLPQTIVTPNSGACMGSGWILLLVPLVALGYFLLHNYQKKAA